MSKKKNWVYTNASYSSHGLMKCCSCNDHITDGDYRYYDSGEAYVCQCYRCGRGDQKWLDKIRKEQQEEERTSIESARGRDYPELLLNRIKDAFFEGWNGCITLSQPYNSPEEAWEESETKKVYDTLAAKWEVSL